MSESSAHATHRQTAKDAWDSFLRSRFDTASVGADLLDIEFEVLQERLPLARKQRNARIMACKIPAEVLTLIFLYLEAVWKPSRPQSDGENAGVTPYGAGWMVVTRVCSAWRKIAVSTPTLWCDLDCLSLHPESVMEIVSRSKALPLILTITGSASKKALENWLCGPVNRRVKRLVVAQRTRAEFFSWIELLFHAMPMLEDLTVDLKADWHEASTHNVLPSEFLAGGCPPRLERLALYGIRCRWDSPLLSPTLVNLFLVSIHQGDAAITSSRLAGVLAPMENLRWLGLSNIFSASRDDGVLSSPPPKELNLVNISSLETSTAPSILAFLEQNPTWVASDITMMLRFVLAEDRIVTAAITMLFSPRGDELLPREMLIARETISILYNEPRPRCQWTGKLSRMLFLPRHTANITLRHIDAAHADDSFDTLVSKLSLLPLAPLTAVYIVSDAVPALRGEDAWIRHFSSATNVSRVAGHYAELLDLICALGVIQDGEIGMEPSFALFPRLEILVFHAVKPANDQDAVAEGNLAVQPDIQEAPECTMNHVALLDLLAIREARGKPVKEIFVDKAMEGWSVWGMPAMRDTTNVSFF